MPASAPSTGPQLMGLLCPKCRTMCQGVQALKEHMQVGLQCRVSCSRFDSVRFAKALLHGGQIRGHQEVTMLQKRNLRLQITWSSKLTLLLRFVRYVTSLSSPIEPWTTT